MHRNIWTAVPRQEHTTASASNGGAPITRSRVVTGHSSFSAYRHDCARFGWTVEHRCQAVLPVPPLTFRNPVIPVSTTLSVPPGPPVPLADRPFPKGLPAISYCKGPCSGGGLRPGQSRRAARLPILPEPRTGRLSTG
jgi:hypothetical protein